MNVLNLFCSVSGNTKKIAEMIEKTANAQEHSVTTVEVTTGFDESSCDFLEYDLVFIGSGVYSWLPPKLMMEYIDRQNKKYTKQSAIHMSSPRIVGKKVVAYCTYGGPHTGINEAVTTPKYLAQLFDHLGFEVAAEWYFPGAFKPSNFVQYSAGGRMGDITGRPNETDLINVAELVKGVLLL